MIRYQLGGKITTKFVGWRAKIYSYLIDGDRDANKNQKTLESVSSKEKFEYHI